MPDYAYRAVDENRSPVAVSIQSDSAERVLIEAKQQNHQVVCLYKLIVCDPPQYRRLLTIPNHLCKEFKSGRCWLPYSGDFKEPIEAGLFSGHFGLFSSVITVDRTIDMVMKVLRKNMLASALMRWNPPTKLELDRWSEPQLESMKVPGVVKKPVAEDTFEAWDGSKNGLPQLPIEVKPLKPNSNSRQGFLINCFKHSEREALLSLMDGVDASELLSTSAFGFAPMRMVYLIILQGIEVQCDGIHIFPENGALRVVYRLNGMYREGLSPPLDELDSISILLCAIVGIKPSELPPQKRDFEIKSGRRAFMISAQSSMTEEGQAIKVSWKVKGKAAPK